jgi:hypothetical protein
VKWAAGAQHSVNDRGSPFRSVRVSYCRNVTGSRSSDADKATTLIELLRETIERDRIPLSPRIKSLKAILAKLDPPPARPQPFPPPKPPAEPSMALAKRRRP